MAWQAFAHFPSYEIVACVSRLMEQGFLAFLEGIYPGTSALLRVRKPIPSRYLTPTALDLRSWTPAQVEKTWNAWCDRLPQEMCPRFMCGAAMFICDLGA